MKARIISIGLVVIILLSARSSHTSKAIEIKIMNCSGEAPVTIQTLTGSGPFGGQPDYDSCWFNIAQSETRVISHKLGVDPENLLVDLQSFGANGSENQLFYGGDNADPYFSSTENNGFWWQELDSTSIKVIRHPDNLSAEKMRVRIWEVPKVDYNSGWRSISAQETLTLEHNLGGNPDDYVVDLQYKSGGNGINNWGYGLDTLYQKNGAEVFFEWGAAWHNLTNKSIKVYRGEHEFQIESVQVRIWRIKHVDYDSGWRDISMGSQEIFNHNLGGPWNDYYIDLQFKDNGIIGTHQIYYGGNQEYFSNSFFMRGAWLDHIDSSQVIVKRGKDDSGVDNVRVRIWANPAPKYDSGWRSLGLNEILNFEHNLGGDPDQFLVDLQFKELDLDGNNGEGIHQINYGGDDIILPGGEGLGRKGAYWQNLTNSNIELRRQADDIQIDKVRIRIWIPTAPSFDSGWTSIDADGNVNIFNHNVGGNPDDYVVDMQFEDLTLATIEGVHQKHYGWTFHSVGSPSRIWSGAAWSNLDQFSMDVIRGSEDQNAGKVRVRIWKNPRPDYDSTWKFLNLGKEEDFDHNLEGNPDNYVLDMQFNDMDYYGVNQNFYGGMTTYQDSIYPTQEGSYWFGLNNSSVKVLREANDSFADQVRVRMWITGNSYSNNMYLPVLVRNK